jgi:hypothetical protein
MKEMKKHALLILVVAAMCASSQGQETTAASAIKPGEPWLDNRGQLIQAHGGGIIKLKKTYFWFGEDRTQTNDPEKRYVACYSSNDLTHWTFRNQVVAISPPEGIGKGFIFERPKVFYNAKTRKYVMYVHLDAPGYKLAKVAVLVSSTVDGNYTYVKSFRPLGQESRDIGQFIDDDGSAYLIFESRPTKGFFIAKLSEDYMTVARQVAFIQAPLEGGAVVHHKGLYYVVGSHLTGWKPNPNVYASAPRLSGPWTGMKDIAPPETNTYDSQSSMLIKAAGKKTTSVIYVGDRWTPKELWNSRYIWMPVEIGNGKLSLPKPSPWTIDIRTGVTTILPTP